MITFPNAKINIFLNIESKRPDGYHNISSFFYPVPLYDALEFKKADRFSLKIKGINTNTSIKDNTVYKSWQLLNDKYGVPPVETILLKNIPVKSGLGGASSDASFFLKGLNDYFELNLSENQLLSLASEICSDCPFFIYNKPAFVTSKGEKIEPSDFTLEGYYLLLVFPETTISTTSAYSKIVPEKKVVDFKNIIISKDFKLWQKHLTNDFESVLPQDLIKIKTMLYDKGALYASLTGSGSAFFGIFDFKPEKLNDYKSMIIKL